MRVVLSDFVSLDGVAQAPGGPEEDTEGGFTNGGWSMPFFDWETMGPAIGEAMATTSALLFGRLGTVYPSAEAAIALVKQLGIVPEWDQYWDRYYGYELRDVDGGVTASTDKGAVLEDLGYGNAMYWPEPEAPVHTLWTAITMPALVLRAAQEILPRFGFILPAAEAERFAAAVPSARVVEIDANHYTITTHDDSIAAIEEYLRTS